MGQERPGSSGRLVDWRRRLMARACNPEPLHIQLLTWLVGQFGSFRAQVGFDCVDRPHYAYGILHAADQARRIGKSQVTVLEFGVAAGAGLMNLCRIAEQVSKVTGVTVSVIGFDTGAGLPPPRDYRDHPEMYQSGDYKMDFEALRRALPPNGELVIGNLADTIPTFLERLEPDAPVGFAAIDVDYYSSTVHALSAFLAEPAHYLPATYLYLDDVGNETHNAWAGELLAVREFNEHSPWRKIEAMRFLRRDRVRQHARWIDQMFALHVLDHPYRQPNQATRPAEELPNPYLV